MAQAAAATKNLLGAATQIELSIPSAVEPRVPSDFDARGFALGRDYAAYGLTPPVEHLHAHSPLLAGWQAGRTVFGSRTHKLRGQSRRWLQLRLSAWLKGRSFEDVQLTPNYLQQIAVTHCPITRETLAAEHISIDRVRDDAGYAAGNLVMMSMTANQAKGAMDFSAASEHAAREERNGGLGCEQWHRVAVLISFVTELPHEQAARLPLVVLPPNRLRLFNPVQALQTLVTRQFMQAGWSQRLARLQALMPEAAQGHFNRFVLALAPRVLAAGSSADALTLRWALEDAWTQELVLQRWTRFALALDAATAERLVQRATQLQLSPTHIQQHDAPRATEGWALERGGYACAAVH